MYGRECIHARTCVIDQVLRESRVTTAEIRDEESPVVLEPCVEIIQQGCLVRDVEDDISTEQRDERCFTRACVPFEGRERHLTSTRHRISMERIASWYRRRLRNESCGPCAEGLDPMLECHANNRPSTSNQPIVLLSTDADHVSGDVDADDFAAVVLNEARSEQRHRIRHALTWAI